MWSFQRSFVVCLFLAAPLQLCAAEASVSGHLTDPQGKPVAGARATLVSERGWQAREAVSDQDGRFVLTEPAGGAYRIKVTAAGFADISTTVTLFDGQALSVDLHFDRLAPRNDAVTVTADVKETDLSHPDPSQRVLVHEEILDANPGRPGAPVSIPGLPIETASSGIKAPQYFAPGVAGDHGEPIAQFLQVGVTWFRTT